jgi:hypothetical protein
MDELIKKKMEIAKRAGELNIEITRLADVALRIKQNSKNGYNKENGVCASALYLKIQGDKLSTNGNELNSYEIDPGGTGLHDALLVFLNDQIDKRTKELDELIKVLA